MKVLEWTGHELLLLDQTKLPQSEELVRCADLEQVCESIESLRIRGAPALGVTAAYAVLLGVKNLAADDEQALYAGLDGVCRRVLKTRPTAVNLSWGVKEMRRTALDFRGASPRGIIRALEGRAREIERDNAERHRILNDLGSELLHDGASVLHHCETGPLATVDYGSALGVIHAAHNSGKAIHVYVDETRPLLQGARLTAWELRKWGIPYTLITDGMAGHFMRLGKIDAAIVGADRIAANGDTANKIGTYSAAVLAAHHDIPFYVAAPLTTVDFDISSGDDIPIEERRPDEVRGFRDHLWAEADAAVGNPAFDVTPSGLIAAIVTEAGIARPPYAESPSSTSRDRRLGGLRDPMSDAQARLGVIGGSGFYDIDGLTNVRQIAIDTPFGEPSDEYVLGDLEGVSVAFLPRHGRGHRIPPTNLNFKANIWGLKSLGVEYVVSVSAVGSMKEDIRPLDVVVPDQLFDRTRARDTTFFNDPGLVVHVGFAEPFCPSLSLITADAAESAGARVHRGGTYICIEGPQFSTKAESQIFRGWGVDVIGMTAIPEAKMAREAEMHYATLAMATDYDVWKGESVSVEMVVANVTKNVEMAKSAVRRVVGNIGKFDESCGCQAALASAIMTSPDAISDELRSKHDLLIGRHLG